MKIAVFVIANLLMLLSGCTDNAVSYPSAQGKPKPYILKQACTFSIVQEYSSASVDSPTVSGIPGATASSSVSLGDISISVANCMLVDNPHDLPIYEN
jgi:hypothetical protein